MSAFILHADSTREHVLERLTAFLRTLPDSKAWRVEVKEYRKRRSQEQNRYLWGVCYATLLREAGEALAGWEADDLHEYFLGEWSGWETLEGFGRKRMRPIKRSSKLSVSEFAEYVDFIHRKAASLGVYIPSPNEADDGLKNDRPFPPLPPLR